MKAVIRIFYLIFAFIISFVFFVIATMVSFQTGPMVNEDDIAHYPVWLSWLMLHIIVCIYCASFLGVLYIFKVRINSFFALSFIVINIVLLLILFILRVIS